jgi:hypothetical protein
MASESKRKAARDVINILAEVSTLLVSRPSSHKKEPPFLVSLIN